MPGLGHSPLVMGFSRTWPLLFLVGCSMNSPTASQSSNLTQSKYCEGGLCFDVSDPVDMAEACPNNIVIGLAGPLACPGLAGVPSGGSWTIEKLFTGPAPGILGRFCRYSWNPTIPGNTPDVSVLPLFGHPTWSDWLDPDCLVVAPAAPTAAEAAAAPVLETAFKQAIEALVQLPQTIPSHGPSKTKVLVVDTAPTTPPPLLGVGQSGHGRAVSLLIQSLVCPLAGGSKCTTEIHNDLALKRFFQGQEIIKDDASGGFFATQGDLAQSIFRGSRAILNASAANRLIVNLSVAWDPQYGGSGAPSNFKTPVLAVYEALRYIRCRDALVFAAAGNDPGGPAAINGPAYPAAWQHHLRPTSSECFADFGLNTPAFGPNRLIQAVSAVGFDDKAALNQRPGAGARLVAPGVSAVTYDHYLSPAQPTKIYTGSSISTAVTSAAAAALWYYRPTLDADQVVQELSRSAINLRRPADFPSGGSYLSNQVKRVSLCHTVRRACARSRVCTSIPSCPAKVPGRQIVVGSLGLTASSTSVSQAPFSYSYALPGSCGSTSLRTDTSTLGSPCPHRQFYGAGVTPWVDPQPSDPVCSTCYCKNDSAHLYLTSKLPGALSSPVLWTKDTYGNTFHRKLEIDPDLLTASASIEVKNLDLGSNELCIGLEFAVDEGKFSTRDPLHNL